MALQTDAEKKINQWIDELRKSRKPSYEQRMKLHARPSHNRLMLWQRNPLSNRYEKTHLVNVASEMRKATGGEVLETAEQVEKALDTLRTALLAAIEVGDRIRLQ